MIITIAIAVGWAVLMIWAVARNNTIYEYRNHLLDLEQDFLLKNPSSFKNRLAFKESLPSYYFMVLNPFYRLNKTAKDVELFYTNPTKGPPMKNQDT